LALEELVQQILLPRPGTTIIHVLIEHAAGADSTDVTVTYGGDAFDPKSTDNDLSLTILENTAAEMKYSYDAQQPLPNRVELRI
ncbi:MAG: hypothetical protein ILP09_00400, partial [Oscillospiraceae bacterium]|nr:hypothetical protein [Oscillospiraceae bacterium]